MAQAQQVGVRLTGRIKQPEELMPARIGLTACAEIVRALSGVLATLDSFENLSTVGVCMHSPLSSLNRIDKRQNHHAICGIRALSKNH